MLAHNVFFTLKDRTDEARAKLVSACKTHLTGHPGVVFFACGTLAEGLDRPVNVRDFDVALHIAFDSIASHDTYQDAPRHHQFVNENREGWASVRVFDSVVESA
jgi:Stress responsive A/B Barrel Domain